MITSSENFLMARGAMKVFAMILLAFHLSVAYVFASDESTTHREQVVKSLEPFMKDGLLTSESFTDKLLEDNEWVANKQRQQIHLFKEMLIQWQRYVAKEVERSESLADEVYAKAVDYQDRLQHICLQGHYMCSQAEKQMMNIAESALNMRMLAAEGYVKANEIERAKKVYRDIIVTFTQQRFSSYIKKAEFALEDIKEIEAKGEAKNKQSRKKGAP